MFVIGLADGVVDARERVLQVLRDREAQIAGRKPPIVVFTNFALIAVAIGSSNRSRSS